MLCAPDNSPLLVAITDLVNLLLAGKTPLPVRGALFGATVLAVTKKQGDIRPIAVGYVWRRLAAKVACSHVKVASASLLAPRQLGFGVFGGADRGSSLCSKALPRQHAARAAVPQNRLQKRVQHATPGRHS